MKLIFTYRVNMESVLNHLALQRYDMLSGVLVDDAWYEFKYLEPELHNKCENDPNCCSSDTFSNHRLRGRGRSEWVLITSGAARTV